MTDADTALERLLAGNRRFQHGNATHPHQTPAHRQQVGPAQHPFAIVLGCADSRMPPELVFDQGLGDLFTIRVGGNILDDLVLASIEFAVTDVAPALLVVLGHSRCGAIGAAVGAIEAGVTPPGHLHAIVDGLRPVVATVLDEPDPVDAAVGANVAAVVAQLPTASDVVARAVTEGALHIVGARYDVDSGRVTLVPPGGGPEAAGAGTGRAHRA